MSGKKGKSAGSTESSNDCHGWEKCQLYQRAFDAIDDAIHVVDPDLRLVTINEVFGTWCREMQDISDDEIIGKNLFDVFDFLGDEIREQCDQVFHTGQISDHRNEFSLKGQKRIFRTKRYPVFDQGEVTHVVSILSDITERDKISSDAQIFKILAETATYAIALVNPDLTIAYANDACAEMHGYTADEMIGKSLDLLHTPEQFEHAGGVLKRFFESGSMKPVEIWRKHRDGSVFPTLTNGTLIRNTDGTPLYIASTAVDISDLHSKEQSLRQSEEKYRLLVEGVESAIAIINNDGVFQFINEYGASMHGKSASQIIGETTWSLYSKEMADIYMANIRKVIATNQVFTEEAETIQENRSHWFSVSIQPYHLLENEPLCALVIAHDVTDRKVAERSLLESQQQYRLLVESLEDSIAVFDYDGKLLFINSHGATPFGAAPEELLGKTQWEMFPQKTADRQMKAIRKVIDTGEGKTIENQTITKYGPVWYSTTLQAYRNAEGKSIGALVIAQNVSQRKLAENALRESEEKFRTLAEQALLGILIYQDGILKYINRAAANMSQNSREEMLKWSAEQVLAAIHPDDRQSVADRAKRRASGEFIDPAIEVQYRVLRPDGSHCWVQQFAKTIDYNGQPATLVTLVDITDRLHARKELEAAKADLENRVQERTVALSDANEMLQIERQSLQQKNVALQELIEQVREGQRRMGDKILANVNLVVMPMIDSLHHKIPENLRRNITEIRRELTEITGDFVDTMQKKLTALTPREIQICNLIKRGYSCKDIASLLDNSVQTVLKQRAMIRKKLGITGKKVNLASHLRGISLQSDENL